MDNRRISQIINYAYGRRYSLDQTPAPVPVGRTRRALESVRPLAAVIFQRRFQITVTVLLIILTAATIYYYNILVMAEQNMQAATNKVSALMQRRDNLSVNLSKAVRDYSEHERNIYLTLLMLRSGMPMDEVKKGKLQDLLKSLPTPDKDAPVNSKNIPITQWDRLLAVSESHPEMKLSANFLNMMTALTEVEKDLAQERIRHADVTNVYSTWVAQFPSNLFAVIFGFKPVTYSPPLEDSKAFKPISY
ncbi:MAG: LemA family protein [Deltaproteobacteria bacterium]|nr:LemA family protein [Deltaproteobacteria bacterium]